jgi:hypothetical protein
MREAMIDLPLRVGQHSVSENLARVTAAVLSFHRQVAPVICSLFADVSLMTAARATLNERGVGPSLSSERLAAYLAAEQQIGRVAADIDVDAAADLLFGATFKIAVIDHLFDYKVSAAKDRKKVQRLVGTIISGLGPRQSTSEAR